ncbi:MAG: hydroxymethylbilane synthase [Geminicoccaceae bacterium]|nr:MAG: hydroxymethylbilane synthase [Geminicoccaceae bacterium]
MKTLKIGTRGSPLALVQAETVAARLQADTPGLATEIVVIKTTGDHVLDRPLSEIGGKGLFTKEIEEALFDQRIDLAVHSFKDVATVLPDGLVIAAVLEREDARDALIAGPLQRIADLPPGAVVGSASLRRRAQLLALRPDLEVVNLRGSVQTRLGKVESGAIHATLLAMAGLNRLGRPDAASAPIAPEEILPAVAQGAIAIEVRADDALTRPLVEALDHRPTSIAVTAERAFLRALDGSCRTPIAAHASLEGDELRFEGLLAEPDGKQLWRTQRRGPVAEADRLGRDAGEEIRSQAGNAFWL